MEGWSVWDAQFCVLPGHSTLAAPGGLRIVFSVDLQGHTANWAKHGLNCGLLCSAMI